MHANSPSGIQVVKKEEKEAKLIAFVQDAVNAYAKGELDNPAAEFLLLARSTQSPAARALAVTAKMIKQAGLTVRTVYMAGEEIDDVLDSSGAGDTCSVRIGQDARLLEAHEQLVLGTRMAWIGDCMRREPDKRDAFESFQHEATDTASWALSAFETIWLTAEPAQHGRGSSLPVLSQTRPAEAAAALAAGTDSDGPTVSTRH